MLLNKLNDRLDNWLNDHFFSQVDSTSLSTEAIIDQLGNLRGLQRLDSISKLEENWQQTRTKFAASLQRRLKSQEARKLDLINALEEEVSAESNPFLSSSEFLAKLEDVAERAIQLEKQLRSLQQEAERAWQLIRTSPSLSLEEMQQIIDKLKRRYLKHKEEALLVDRRLGYLQVTITPARDFAQSLALQTGLLTKDAGPSHDLVLVDTNEKISELTLKQRPEREAEMETLIAQYQALLKRLSKIRADYQDHLEEKAHDSRRLREMLGSFDQSLSERRQEKESLERKLKQVRRKIELGTGRKEELSDKRQDLVASINELGQSIQDLEAEIKNLRQQHAELNQEKSNQEQNIASIRAEMDELSQEVEKYREGLIEKKKAKDKLKSQLEKVESKVAVLNAELQESRDQAAKLSTEVDQLKSQVEQLEKEKGQLVQEWKVKQGEVEELQQKLDLLHDEVQKFEQEQKEKQDRIPDLKKNIQKAQTSIDRLSQRKSEVQNQLERIRVESQKLAAQLVEQQEEVEPMQQKNETLQEELQSLKDANSNLEVDLAQAKSKRQSLSRELAVYEKQVAKLKESKGELERKIEDLQAQIEQLEALVSKKKEQELGLLEQLDSNFKALKDLELESETVNYQSLKNNLKTFVQILRKIQSSITDLSRQYQGATFEMSQQLSKWKEGGNPLEVEVEQAIEESKELLRQETALQSQIVGQLRWLESKLNKLSQRINEHYEGGEQDNLLELLVQAIGLSTDEMTENSIFQLKQRLASLIETNERYLFPNLKQLLDELDSDAGGSELLKAGEQIFSPVSELKTKINSIKLINLPRAEQNEKEWLDALNNIHSELEAYLQVLEETSTLFRKAYDQEKLVLGSETKAEIRAEAKKVKQKVLLLEQVIETVQADLEYLEQVTAELGNRFQQADIESDQLKQLHEKIRSLVNKSMFDIDTDIDYRLRYLSRYQSLYQDLHNKWKALLDD
jgi:chromosome segregation ATPase